MPNENELFALQSELGKQTDIQTDANAARAAMGLTEFEAETAYALSLIRKGRFSTSVISEAKSQMIRKSGLMEFWSPADINDVGGLGNLKAFIQNRSKAFLPENSKFLIQRDCCWSESPGPANLYHRKQPHRFWDGH